MLPASYNRIDLDAALAAIRASKQVKGDQTFKTAAWFHALGAMAAHASPRKHPPATGYKNALILRDRCGIDQPGAIESWWLAAWLASPRPGDALKIGDSCANVAGLEKSLDLGEISPLQTSLSCVIASTEDTLPDGLSTDVRMVLIGESNAEAPVTGVRLAYEIRLVDLAKLFVYDDQIGGGEAIVIDVEDIGTPAIEALKAVPARSGAKKMAAANVVGMPDPIKPHKATIARHGVNHVFDGYNPRRAVINFSTKHPAALIEPKTLASTETPPITATPRLPREILEKGIISDAQFEAIAMMMTAHEKIMPGGQRFGFLLADGTGVGKTNEQIGLILANWNEGRRRAIYVTEKDRHKMNVEKAMMMLGIPRRNLIDLDNFSVNDSIVDRDGILFLTYSKLREIEDDKFLRLPQLIEWFGEKKDGVLMFDESHNLRNAISDDQGYWGGSPTSNQGKVGVELQDSLPNARVVYASATGCSDAHNLGYMTRLRLWGDGTQFEDQKLFMAMLNKSGLSGLEMISAHLVACGLMISRTLSLEGVIVSTLTHALTPVEKQQWDTIATIFATIRNGLADAWQRALEPWRRTTKTGMTHHATEGGDLIPAEAIGHYESAVRRIAELMLVCMKTPILIADIQNTVKNGDAAVVQLMNTYEGDTDDYASTIVSTVRRLVEQVVPVEAKYKIKEHRRNQLNSYATFAPNTTPIPIVANEQFRDHIIAMLENAPKLSSPLDQLMAALGSDHLAEITGRSTRRVIDPATKKVTTETRSESSTRADLAAFMGDRKQVLVFTVGAGGASMDYHAALDVRNQRKRRHYILQAGHRADQAVQGIGRSHRANQKQPPEVVLVSTDLPAERAYRSQTLSKIRKLGASSQGHRNAAAGSFSMVDSYDNEHARAAFVQFLDNISTNQYVDLPCKEFESSTGLTLVNRRGEKTYTADPKLFKRILTRLARTNIALQEKAFAHIDNEVEKVISASIKDRTFDSGPQALSDLIQIESEETLIRDNHTGAVIKSYHVSGIKIGKLMTFDEARDEADLYNIIGMPLRFAWSPDTSRIWIQVTTELDASGYPKTYRLIEPNQTLLIESTNEFLYKSKPMHHALMTRIQDMWEARCESLEELANKPAVILCGALPMIFPFINENGGVDRPIVADSTDGRRIMGIRVTPEQASIIAMKAAPLISQTQSKKSTDAKHLMVEIAASKTIVLDNNWMINKQQALGKMETELHVSTKDKKAVQKAAQTLGLRTVTLGTETRLFFPVDVRDYRKTLEAILTFAPMRSIDTVTDWSLLN